MAFDFAPLHHSAEWDSGPEPDPELVEGFRGQILKANDSDVPSVSDNASIVPKESPPCHPWLGPPPFVPPPFVPPPFVPPPSSLLGPHAGSVSIPKPDDVEPLGGPLYIPSGNSSLSASEQENQPMDMSEVNQF